MKYLITGAAGFIGYHLADKLCREDYDITGVDNLNSYYDVNLKESRLKDLSFIYIIFILNLSGITSLT